MKQYVLGIDVGLTNTKAVLYSTTGIYTAEAKKKTPLLSERENTSEIPMLRLWENVKSVVKDVLKTSGVDPKHIAGIGVSGHGNGLYYTDETGKPIDNAVTSMDHRASELVEKLNIAEKTLRKTTLQSIWDGQPGVILKWLKINRPGIYEKIGHVMLCKDWITHCFTGEYTSDYSDMSASGLMDNIARKYSNDILIALDIREIGEKLPDLLKSFEIAGNVTLKAEEETGLKKGTPVIAGLFDVDACGIGAGFIREDQFCSIAGTWNINMGLIKKHVDNRDIRQCTIRGDNSAYLAIDSSPTSSSNIDWVMKNVIGKKVTFEQFENILSQNRLKENKILFLPLIYGGLGNENKGGVFVNLRSYHNYKDLLFAAAEGICFAHNYHLLNLIKSGSHAKTIRLTGGASRNPYWCQMFADVTGFTVEIPESPQTGALGLSMMVCLGIGLFKNLEESVNRIVKVERTYIPDSGKNSIYKEKYGGFIKLLNSIRSL